MRKRPAGFIVPAQPVGNLTPSLSQIPDLNLSIHPARAIARRLPPSTDDQAPPVASWPDPVAMTCPTSRARGSR